jgi:hypothetical protein
MISGGIASWAVRNQVLKITQFLGKIKKKVERAQILMVSLQGLVVKQIFNRNGKTENNDMVANTGKRGSDKNA